MIKSDRENQVTCETCEKPATRRAFLVVYPGVLTADVYYDTHAESLTEDGHFAALKRLDDFYTKAVEILANVRALPPEEKELPIGQIVSFDLDTVAPSACERRQQLIIIALIRAYGLSTEVKTSAISIEEFSIDEAIGQLKKRAALATADLKRRYDKGRF